MPAITAQELELKITDLISSFNLLIIQEQPNFDHLRALLEEIYFYFNNSNYVKDAVILGGLKQLREKYASELLRISLRINPDVNRIFDEKEAKIINQGFTLWAQHYKINRAYADIYAGKKFKKAGVLPPDEGEVNPILELSKKNIQNLISRLKKFRGDPSKPYGLKANEHSLFEALINLPLRLQHATNHWYPIQNAGSLDSYTEIKRYNPDYQSPFSTKGNIKKLGNGSFVFFRAFVESANSSQTRYGDTSLTFDLNLLESCGWVSLHDQLKPFPKPNTQHFYWEKRLLRTAEVYKRKSNTQDPGLQDGLLYKYRGKEIEQFNSGRKDTLKSFGDNISVSNGRKRSFLGEIFFGNHIRLGIALSVIKELRYLDTCGFYVYFLNEFSKANPNEKISLLGELIKGLFRIEGKYPVAVRMEIDSLNNSLFFKPMVKQERLQKSQRKFEVLNPDGDGRYNSDMSTNKKMWALGIAREKYKNLTENISITRRLRAKFKDDENKVALYDGQLQGYITEQKKILKILNNDIRIRGDLIECLVEEYKVDKSLLEKINTFKLNFICTYCDELLAEELVSVNQLLAIPNKCLELLFHIGLAELIVNQKVILDFANCLTLEAYDAQIYEIGKELLSISEAQYTRKIDLSESAEFEGLCEIINYLNNDDRNLALSNHLAQEAANLQAKFNDEDQSLDSTTDDDTNSCSYSSSNSCSLSGSN